LSPRNDILTNDKERLDGPNPSFGVAHSEVQVVEFEMNGIPDIFVITAVLVLRFKCKLALRALSQFTAGNDLDALHFSLGTSVCGCCTAEAS
jgi:hypothetical protein